MKRSIANTLILIIAPLFLSTAIMGMELDPALESSSSHAQVAIINFEESKDLLAKHLEELDSAELHFFWTTGRTLSENPNYNPNTRVNIGGEKWGQKFFPYVKKLLEVSPKKLKIKVTGDALTAKSNTLQIGEILELYPNRFEMIFSDIVCTNLKKRFPLYSKKLDIIFQNATGGIPVIPSDIYRIVAPIFGYDHAPDVFKTLYTYCDVDNFCAGMESTQYFNLINALFDPIKEKANSLDFDFYFGKTTGNNDLIKIRVKDIDAYSDFCNKMLKKIKIDNDVFTHFVELHDRIKECEQKPDLATHLVHSPPVKNLVLTIMTATGPNFLKGNHVTDDLSYPHNLDGEWYSPEEYLDHTIARYQYTHPPSVLNWGCGTVATPEERAAEEEFTGDCDVYRAILSEAFYAKRFGDNHPFNVEIRNRLVENYPYHKQSFTKLLELNFTHHSQDKQRKYRLKLKEDDFNQEECEEGEIYLSQEEDNKISFIVKISENNFIQSSINTIYKK